MTGCIVLFTMLMLPVSAIAGEPGTLLDLLESYDDHTRRVHDVRAARAEGASYESGHMLDLKRDLLAAIKAVDEYRAQLLRDREKAASHEVPLALKHAYLAMFHVISLELDHHLYRSDVALTLSEKYVEIWRAADFSIPRGPARTS